MSELPSGWIKKSGEDVTTKITKGASPKWQGFTYQKSGMLFITSENVRDGFIDISSPKFLPLEFHQKLTNSQLRRGDILINIVGASIGRACIWNEKVEHANVNQAVCVFRLKPEYDPQFVLNYLIYPQNMNRLLGYQSETARPNLSLANLRHFKFALPPLPEQRAIARILSTWDEAIALVGALIDALTLRKRGLMQVLLTGKVRFPGFEDEWEEVRLGDVVKEFIVPMRDKPKKFMGEIPWCRIEDFDGIYLSDSKSGQYVDENIINQMNLKVFPSGSLLVSCSADLGRCAITTRPLITNQTFIGLVTSELIDTLFLYYLMSSSSHQLNRLSSGTTIAYLSRKEFEKFRVRIPQTLAEQIQIAELLSSLDGAIDDATLTRTHLQRQKKGLMQVLLTGKVRVDGIGEDT
jgi:type I restriction enzyme S subunit